MADVRVRFARERDYEGVVEISEGLYQGQDYFPCVFHEWLRMPNRQMFVAELNGKIIGLSSVWIIDDGKTFYAEASRVHPQFTRQGVITKLSKETNNFVRCKYPSVTLKKSITSEQNINSMALSRKAGNEPVLRVYMPQWHVKDKTALRMRLRDLYPEDSVLALYPYSKQEVQDVILSKPIAIDALFYLKRLAWIDLWVLDARARSNIDHLFKDGDRMFADRAPSECFGDAFPKSLSHGRRSDRVKATQWTCTIYTQDHSHFLAHVIQQLKTGMEEIKGPFVFNVVHSRIFIRESHHLFEKDFKLERTAHIRYLKVLFENDFLRHNVAKL